MKKLFSLLTLALLTLSVGAANTYVKVTSADQLVAGQKYILVNEEANVGMGVISSTSTKYGTTVSIAISNGAVDIDGTAVVELTLGGATGAWTFDFGNGAYMYWSSGNSLNTNSDATNAGAQWIATSTADGYVLNNAGTPDRLLQFNSGNPRFACYTSTQKPAVLYVQDASVTPPVVVAAPTLPAAQEFTESLTVTITNNEDGADLYYSYDGETWTAYTQPLVLTATTTVYAKAEKNGVESTVVHQTYTKVDPVPDPLGNTYALVTNVSELADGDQIIFVNSGVAGDAKAMGNQNGNGNNFLSTDVTICEDLKITNDAVQVLCLEANGDNWYLKTLAGKYLYAASSSSNYLKLENAPDENDNAVASIAIADSAIVVFQGSNTHNIVRYNYNNGTPLFSCYLPEKMAPIYIYKSTGEEEEFVAAPTLPASQEFEDSFTVTITAEDGATIMYSYDGETWYTYNEPLVINETKTVYAKAVKGDVESTVVSATYTLKVGPATVANIAEGNALADGTEFTFTGEAVVCFKNNKNMWIRDASGSVQVYGSANFGDEFQKGVVITPNWGAKKATYNGMHEYTTLTNFTASNQTQTVEPYVRETLTVGNANEYVVLQNVTIDSTYTSGNKPNYVTNTGIICRNNYNVTFVPEAGVAYNIIGIVTLYNNIPQLYITEVEGYVAPIATPNNLAEANNLADNMQFTYQNDVAATYQSGNYLFIRDEDGNSGLIFGAVEATFATGDVLGADWGATKTTYYGVPEYTNPTDVTNSGDTWTVEPYERETLTTANVNEYVIMKGLSLVACTDTTVNHYDKTYYSVPDSMVVFNQFGVDMSALDESKTYDVIGIATIYHEKAQLYIISMTEVEDVTVLIGDVNEDGNIDITDVTLLISAVLTGDMSGINTANGDCDGSTIIDITDVTMLISRVLTGAW